MTTVRRTNRWRGVIAVALFASTVGIFAKRPLVLLAGVIGIVFAAYPHLRGPPSPELSIDRRLSDEAPGLDDEVEVTVTVRNEGAATLWDVRLVDGVPPMLSVVSGTARHTAVLRPGATTSFTYTLRAVQGTHHFDAATAFVRDVSGASEVETTVAADTTIECTASIPPVPLRQQTRDLAGRIVTDQGGSGIEFHRTREYQYGDPMSRVDWKRFARTDELTTVEFREERAATVVLCVDARHAAYCGRPDEPHAVSHSLVATEGLLASLLDTRERVGLAALGREFCWLAPGGGPNHAARARHLLATHPAFSLTPPGDGADRTVDAQVDELRKRLGSDAQVVLLSPLSDDFIARAALRLEALGHAVTVISPDVTSAETVGERLAHVERDNGISSLRNSGVFVVDWSPDQPLGTAIMQTQERWSA